MTSPFSFTGLFFHRFHQLWRGSKRLPLLRTSEDCRDTILYRLDVARHTVSKHWRDTLWDHDNVRKLLVNLFGFISFRECLCCNILQPRDCNISRMKPKQVTISKPSQWTRLDNEDHRLYVATLAPIRRIMCHLCRLAAQRPCPVWKRFSVDHVGRWRLKPGSLMVGSEIRFLLVTEFDCQSYLFG